MSDPIGRPSFYEGQLLRAADLELGLEYARGSLARQDRYLHTPGIATGLDLSVDKSTGITQVKLSPGMAIDATGRQIVVDRQETLSPEVLESQGVLIPEDTDQSVDQASRPWHPVFVVGRDESSTPPSLSTGCGGNGAQPNRTDEAYDISYGRPGDTTDVPAVQVSDGPDSDTAVRVLIGYVQWDGASNFGDASAAPKIGLSADYAGVRADSVVARGGTLSLRADLGETREKRPALVLDGDAGGEMRFGLQDANGVVNPVFKVSSAGDLTLSGVIKSPFSNDMWAESGIVFDGMLVPLPAGVTQQTVDDGQIVLHISVTPRCVAQPFPPGETSGNWIREPFECRVDGRRVFARERWFKLTNPPTFIKIPAACNYLILASVAGRTP
jgi:hypothetical protein